MQNQPQKSKIDRRTLGIIALTAIFALAGVGTAFWLGVSQSKPETNAANVSTLASVPTQTTEKDLHIKGNKNSMIYHLPGCASYNRIEDKNIIWFKTTEEAEARGFRMAKNC